jgi:uncharacterized protein DUF5996
MASCAPKSLSSASSVDHRRLRSTAPSRSWTSPRLWNREIARRRLLAGQSSWARVCRVLMTLGRGSDWGSTLLTTLASPQNGYDVIEGPHSADTGLIQFCSANGESFPLEAMAVADFYNEFMQRLRGLGIDIHIWTMPGEIENAIPFDRDRTHAQYDPVYAQKFWLALVQASRVMNEFRARFIGKASPVHFFWGSFDLAVTRFSGARRRRRSSCPTMPCTSRATPTRSYSDSCRKRTSLRRSWRNGIVRRWSASPLCVSGCPWRTRGAKIDVHPSFNSKEQSNG